MGLTDLHKRTAQAIVNIFETGEPAGDYAAVTVLPGDTGHLTYGRAQTTLGSGNLHLLISAYCAAPGARLADALRPYLPRLRDIDLALDTDRDLHRLLAAAGADPVMRDVQDAFFDRLFWTPALLSAQALELADPLSVAVVYDSRVHGSWHRIRDRVNSARGTPAQVGARAWTRAYVDARRDWLAGHANHLLRRTVYRMDAFAGLMAEERWDLALPLTVRGRHIDESVLAGPPTRASAEDIAQRTMRLTDPPMTGSDVEALERELARRGWAINADGVFDAGTERCVRQFQEETGLVVDGIAGPATLGALGLE